MATLLAGHAYLVCRLIDDELFLHPDSTEYLIGARSLATGHGYCDLSQPGMPRVYRPIGVSLLLAPVVGWRGYDVVACKLVILLTSLGECLVTFLLARRIVSWGLAYLLLLLLVISPVAQFYHGQVISEVPFALFSSAIVFLIAGGAAADEPRNLGRLVLICLLTIAAEKTRIVGIVLWPSLIVWGLCRSDRRRVVSIVLVAIGVSILFNLLPVTGNAPIRHYLQFFSRVFSEQGAFGVWVGALSALRLYVGSLIAICVPAMWPDLEYFGVGYQGAILASIGLIGGTAVSLVVLLGLWRRFRAVGPSGEAVFVAVYFAGSLAVLLLWPRQIRMLYPLVPLAAVYFWYGVTQLRPRMLQGLVAVACVVFHVEACMRLVVSGTKPSTGWQDWNRAGAWLRENTDTSARVLTSHKHLFLRSGRFQKLLLGYGVSLDELNEALHSSGAPYVRFEGWQNDARLLSNPAFLFRPVDVETGEDPLWAVEPNFMGTVSLNPPSGPTRLPAAASSDRASVPSHVDVLKRADRLHRNGQLEQAERLLREFVTTSAAHSPGVTDAWVQLGNLLIHAGRPQEAISCFEQALAGSNADSYLQAIATATAIAQAHLRAEDESVPSSERAEILERMAWVHAGMARWSAALKSVDRSVELDHGRLSARLLRVLLLRRFGDREAALSEIEIVFELLQTLVPESQARWRHPAHATAVRQLLLIRVPEILLGDRAEELDLDGHVVRVDPDDPKTVLDTARLLQEDGLRGVAIRVLESATARHPAASESWRALGEQWAAFGRFESALECYRRAEQLGPNRLGAAQAREIERVLATAPVR